MFGLTAKIGQAIGELLTALDHLCRAVELSSKDPKVTLQVSMAREALARGREVAEGMLGPLGADE